MPANPYESPTSEHIEAPCEVPSPAGLFAHPLVLSVLGIVLGGVLGVVSYVSVLVLLEHLLIPRIVQPGAARLSYGQQAVLIMTPLAGLFGAGIGLSMALTRIAGRKNAAALLGAWTAVVLAIVAGLWRSSIAMHGRDVSEVLLFGPFAVVGVAALVLAVATWISR